ncbi:MAG: iron ABC transporter permease [Phycisphaerales bacterium]
MTHRRTLGLFLLCGTLAAVALLRLLATRSLDGTLHVGWPGAELGQYRVGAVASATLAGALLGVAGALLQGLLRNPLASPFVLGVSSGAGCGVAVALAISSSVAGAASAATVTLGAPILPATLGALAALAAVLALGRRNGVSDPTTVVLAGVIVGAVAAAGTMLAESALPLSRRGEISAWMLGRVPESPDHTALALSAAALAVSLAVAVAVGRRLDASALSDDEARSVGVPVHRTRLVVLATAGLATAASVVLCGPIAFVGLIAPHVARGAVGPTHRTLCVASAIAGAALLLAAEAARQFIHLGGGRLPVGALTALVGGVAFLWLLRRTAGGWQP